MMCTAMNNLLSTKTLASSAEFTLDIEPPCAGMRLTGFAAPVNPPC
jgi:hypothetical protein